jgi:hypothetical protein
MICHFQTLNLDHLDDLCLEERIFFRLISGLHTSINTHLCARYELDKQSGIWYSNPEIFKSTVGSYMDRIENLYFAFLFLLRYFLCFRSPITPQFPPFLTLFQSYAQSRSFSRKIFLQHWKRRRRQTTFNISPTTTNHGFTLFSKFWRVDII